MANLKLLVDFNYHRPGEIHVQRRIQKGTVIGTDFFNGEGGRHGLTRDMVGVTDDDIGPAPRDLAAEARALAAHDEAVTRSQKLARLKEDMILEAEAKAEALAEAEAAMEAEKKTGKK